MNLRASLWDCSSQALVMEERFCVAAARMGHSTAEELKKGHMEEQRALQAKLQEQMGRQSSLAHEAQSYHTVEASRADCHNITI